jgi:hypothetical protein
VHSFFHLQSTNTYTHLSRLETYLSHCSRVPWHRAPLITNHSLPHFQLTSTYATMYTMAHVYLVCLDDRATSPALKRGLQEEIWAQRKACSLVSVAWRQVTTANRRACLSSLTLSLLAPHPLSVGPPGDDRLAHHLHFSSISHVNNSRTRTNNTHSISKQKSHWILT